MDIGYLFMGYLLVICLTNESVNEMMSHNLPPMQRYPQARNLALPSRKKITLSSSKNSVTKCINNNNLYMVPNAGSLLVATTIKISLTATWLLLNAVVWHLTIGAFINCFLTMPR